MQTPDIGFWAIANETPKDIAFTRDHYVSTLATVNVQPFPASGVKEFKFDGPSNATDPKFFFSYR